jgi:hypothetical protein
MCVNSREVAGYCAGSWAIRPWMDGWMDGWMDAFCRLYYTCMCVCVFVPCTWYMYRMHACRTEKILRFSKIWRGRSTFGRSWCANGCWSLGYKACFDNLWDSFIFLAAYQMGLALFLATYLDSWNLGFSNPWDRLISRVESPLEVQVGHLSSLCCNSSWLMALKRWGWYSYHGSSVHSPYGSQVHWGCQWTH